ncbi:T3SS effector HopA1 family protein [Streptomyces sp. ET3-23]|uniref:T3SS effector HopA1 family protein n=1 Tax=Streptomyces sp. ET3-23 TaxID=2885643 RepID=UPI001D11A75D|nr:T3SS effector HopA1 family protein [Streptomyces sp. ET3-23]MCC2274082.1 T3SS effector HopA1 family protein [Streptomyces sp. ET3-23]
MTLDVPVPHRSSTHLFAALSGVEIAEDRHAAYVLGHRIPGGSPEELGRRLAVALHALLHIGHPAPTLPPEPPCPDVAYKAVLAGVVPDSCRLVPDGSPGWLTACGSRAQEPGGETLRVYVHLVGPALAPTVWGAVLRSLEVEAGVPFVARVLADPGRHPRRDALAVRLSAADRHVAGAVAAAVQGLPGVGASVSRFAEPLGAGVAAGWEPAGPRPDFGRHRAGVVAQALATAPVGADLPHVLATACLRAGIDPTALARNLSSPSLERTCVRDA